VWPVAALLILLLFCSLAFLGLNLAFVLANFSTVTTIQSLQEYVQFVYLFSIVLAFSANHVPWLLLVQLANHVHHTKFIFVAVILLSAGCTKNLSFDSYLLVAI
jgi:hypothetical protein